MLSTRQVARLVLAAALLFGMVPSAMAAPGSGSFVDDDRSRYEPYIEAARAAGIVSGCNPPADDRFCPHNVVRRGELAVMLSGALGLPLARSDYFDDDNGHFAETAINALAEAGAIIGCGERSYCPDEKISRGELASMVAAGSGWALPANTYPYTDPDESSQSLALKALARRGAIEPCNPPTDTRLCPGGSITRDEAVFVVTSATGIAPLPTPSRDEGESTLGFEEAFESLSLWDGSRPGSRNRVGLTETGFKGSGLRVTIPKGSHFGADFKLDLSSVAGEEPEQLFFRYLLRLDPDWAPRIGGKLPGFSGVYGHTGKGGYRSTELAPGWSARMEFFGSSADDPRARLGYYVYHLGQEGRYGDGMSWNEAGMLVPGEWYCVEGEVALNRPGISDGALRAWVDGTPVFDASGIQFRRPNEPNIKIESFWFNVYYGGKPRAERDFGMTVDEVIVDTTRVGCGSGDGLARTVSGDFTGDGFDDSLRWGSCPGGTCFEVRPTTADGPGVLRRLGDGAWFSLDTSRVGMTAADVNGDGRDDIVYPGRCDDSTRCWRVHLSEGSALGTPQNWGGDLRIAPEARSIIAGDWNGDGFDDLVYQGLCGAESVSCWRAHLSRNGRLEAASWGSFPDIAAGAEVSTADLDGDGREDLLYAAPCQAGTCWFGQISGDTGFERPTILGMARTEEIDLKEMFDFDGDGDDDLVTIAPSGGGFEVAARQVGMDGLGDVTTLDTLSTPVSALALRRTGSGRPIEALLTTTCEDSPCVERRIGYSGRLLTEPEFEGAVQPSAQPLVGATPR